MPAGFERAVGQGAYHEEAAVRIAKKHSLFALLMASTSLAPMAGFAQEEDTVITLGEIVIRALNDGGEGATGVEAMNTAGARVPVDPQDLPRAMTVVPSEYFETRGARTMEETLSYTPGLATETYGQDDRYDEYVIRGFEAQSTGTYRDGLPLRTVDWASWRTEPFGLESVNVLRGPTSDLYGMNEPGGLVNGVSKRPGFTREGKAHLRFGSHEAAEFAVDYQDLLSDTLAYRVVGVAKAGGTNFDEVDTSRLYVAPSLTWAPSDATSLTVYGQYQKDDVGDSYVLLPQYGTQFDNAYGAVDPDTYTGNPDYNTIETTQNYLGYELEHQLGDRLTWVSRARYSKADWLNETMFPGMFVNGAYLGLGGTSYDPTAVDTVLWLNFYVDQDLEQFSADNAVMYEFDTAHGVGTLAVGVDHYTVDSVTDYGFGYSGELNFLTGETTSLFDGVLPSYLASKALTDIRQTGLYVSGAADVAPKLKMTGGLRYDDVSYERKGYSTGLDGVAVPMAVAVDGGFTSGNLGLSYQLAEGLNLYGAVARSFNLPPDGTDADLNALDLEESRSFEAGVKYASPDGATDLTFAVFNIEKRNATFDDPDVVDATVMTQVGKLRARGVEIGAIHDFGNGLSLFGTLSYTDATVRKDAVYGGNKAARVPGWTASLYGQYDINAVPGLSIGAGARYTGVRYADIANDYKLDDLTLFDASVTYEWSDWQAQFTARNLADTRDVAYCTDVMIPPSSLGLSELDDASAGCSVTSGRELSLTLSRSF